MPADEIPSDAVPFVSVSLVLVVLGLILVGLRVDRYFVGTPDLYLFGPMREAMKWLGNGAFPLALVITGALMFDMLRVERPSARIALGGSVLRLVVIPLIILAAAKCLPHSLELRQVLVVQAAMPAAMSPLLIAKLYGGRADHRGFDSNQPLHPALGDCLWHEMDSPLT